MTNDKLSDFAVKQAKLREAPFKLTDGAGLYLLLQPQGGSHCMF